MFVGGPDFNLHTPEKGLKTREKQQQQQQQQQQKNNKKKKQTKKQGLASKKAFSAKEVHVPPPCFVSCQNESNLSANQIQGKHTNVSKNYN